MISIDVVGEALRLLAVVTRHHNDGDVVEAERVYLRVLETGYREIDIHRLLGGICFETRRYAEAEIHWRRVLDAVPGDVATLIALAAIGHLFGRPADAAEWLLAVEAIQPQHPFVVANLGTALLDAGRRDEAVDAFKRALRLRPRDPLLSHRLKRATSAAVPYWHIPMMNDAPRNQAFRTAIERAVTRHGHTAHVLEIGTGAGLLQWMCIDLDAETSFTTHPQAYSGAGLTQVVHALGAPIPVKAGDVLRLRVGHDRTSLLVQRTDQLF